MQQPLLEQGYHGQFRTGTINAGKTGRHYRHRCFTSRFNDSKASGKIDRLFGHRQGVMNANLIGLASRDSVLTQQISTIQEMMVKSFNISNDSGIPLDISDDSLFQTFRILSFLNIKRVKAHPLSLSSLHCLVPSCSIHRKRKRRQTIFQTIVYVLPTTITF